jgi:hypothetical protein
MKRLLISAVAALGLFAAGAAQATGSVHIEWMQGDTVYGSQTISATSTSVASSPAPTFASAAVPTGQARISVTGGAVIVTWGNSPTATQTNGIRLQVGSPPAVVQVNTGQEVAAAEAGARRPARRGRSWTAGA